MNGVCGNYQELEQSVHSGRGLRTSLCSCALWAAFAALVLPAVGTAAQQPNPQQLWRQYPLHTKPSGSSPGSRSGSTRTTGATRPRSHSQPKHSGKSKDGTIMPWLAIVWAACFLGALAWSVSLIRQFQRRAPKPRQRESANGQIAVEEALRAVVRGRTYHHERTAELTSETAVLKLKHAVATADPAAELKKKAGIGVPRDDAGQHHDDVL